jgi:mannosyltransferase
MNTPVTVHSNVSPFEWDYLEKTSDWLLVCIPILVLLILTIPYLSRGYWDDEIFSIMISRSWSGLRENLHNYETNMSLYYIVLYGWMWIFGEGEITTHILSLIFASLSLAFFYKLARIWLNKSSALMGGLLLAANSLFAFLSLEARSYSMLVLACSISSLVFVRLDRKPGTGLAICYGISIAISTYVHYFGILMIIVHGVTISWRKLTRQQFNYFLLSGMVILFGLLPLLLFPLHTKSQVDWISMPDLKYLWYTCKDLVGGGLDFLILLFCLFFVIKKGYWRNVSDNEFFLQRLVLAWTIIPTLLIFIFSYLVKPIFLTRYFIWCLPGAVLLTCLIITYTGWDNIRKSIVWLLLFIIMLKRSYAVLNLRGSGYKEAVQYLNETVKPGESVLTYPYYKSVHILFYQNKMQTPNSFVKPVSITKFSYLAGGGGTDPDPDLAVIEKIAADTGKIYLIVREKWDSHYSDSVQNRNWLPEIQKIIQNKHPRQQTKIFGVGSMEPIGIIIYE